MDWNPLEHDVLAVSIYQAHRRAYSFEDKPELRLLFTVLEDAVLVVLGKTTAQSHGRFARDRLIEETIGWFYDDAHTGPTAYRTICEIFHMDADRLRDGVMKQRAQGHLRVARIGISGMVLSHHEKAA